MNKPELKKLIFECIDDVQNEEKEKWIQAAVHPSNKGMFAGVPIEKIQSTLAKLKAKTEMLRGQGLKVPHELKSKIAQLIFALRAKQHKLT